MDNGKAAALLIPGFLLVWVVIGFCGYLFAETGHFQCYGGDGGFIARAWYGYMGGKEPPPNPLFGDRFNERLRAGTDPLRTGTDIPEIEKANSFKKTAILIGGTLLGYSVGGSVRYAVSAKKCPPSLLSQ